MVNALWDNGENQGKGRRMRMKKKIVLLVLAVLLCATGVFAIATYVNQDAVLSGVKKVGEVPALSLIHI